MVQDSIHYGSQQLGYYDWDACVVMANHVHLLAWPKAPPPKLLRSLKSYTGREANKLLGRAGESFWQKESYDHWVRNDDELRRIRVYIEQNPVKAGLVTKAEDYPWSSAATRAVNPPPNETTWRQRGARLRRAASRLWRVVRGIAFSHGIRLVYSVKRLARLTVGHRPNAARHSRAPRRGRRVAMSPAGKYVERRPCIDAG